MGDYSWTIEENQELKMFKGYLKKFAPTVLATMAIAGKYIGKMAVTEIQSHIDKQDLPWVPLAESTIRQKKGSTAIYVDGGFFRNNIEVKFKPTAMGFEVEVGPSEVKHPGSNLSMKDLAMILEYGTHNGHIPPRPLWRPVWERLAPKMDVEMVELGAVMIAALSGKRSRFAK